MENNALPGLIRKVLGSPLLALYPQTRLVKEKYETIEKTIKTIEERKSSKYTLNYETKIYLVCCPCIIIGSL